jgi:hypothetical protein
MIGLVSIPEMPSLQLTGKPYPWSLEGGLCPLLDDPMLWAKALSDAQRGGVKTAAKRCGRRGVIPITDDEKIGKLCCWMLGDAGRRKLLADVLRRHGVSPIHQALWNAYYAADEEMKSLFPDETFSKDENGLLFINTEALEDRLNKVQPRDKNLRSIAVLSAAFAMLQPEQAPTILQVLLRYNRQLESVLLGPENNDQQPAGGETDSAKMPSVFPSEGLTTNTDDLAGTGSGLVINRAWLTNGKKTITAFINAHSELVAFATRLTKMVNEASLSSDKLLEAEARELTRAAEVMSSAAQTMDSWMDQWLEPLEKATTSAPNTARDSLAALLQSFRKQRTTVAEAASVCAVAHNRLVDISEAQAEATAEFQGLQRKVRSIAEDISVPVTELVNEVVPDDWIKITSHIDQLRNERDRLGKERASLLGSRRAKVEARFRAIEPEKRVDDPMMRSKLERIQKAINDAANFGQLLTAEVALQNLEQEWRALVPKRSINEIASSLAVEPNPEELLLLADELHAALRAAEAALAFEFLQRLHEPESLDVDLGEFIGKQLLIWSTLGQLAGARQQSLVDSEGRSRAPKGWRMFARNLSSSWPVYALSGRWVSTVQKGDVASPKLQARLAGIFLALHAGKKSGSFMESFYYRFDLAEFQFGKDFPHLQKLLRDVVEQRAFLISDGSRENKISDAKAEVTNFFLRQEDGDFLHQIAHGNNVGNVERQTLFPKLQSYAESILLQCDRNSISDAHDYFRQIEDIAYEAFREHGISATESPFYHRKIFGQQGYLATLGERLLRLREACGSRPVSAGSDRAAVTATQLGTEIDLLISRDSEFADFWTGVRLCIERESPDSGETTADEISGVEVLVNVFPEVMVAAPDLVLAFSSNDKPPLLTPQELRGFLDSMTHSRPPLEGAGQLAALGCLQHGAIVALGDEYETANAERLLDDYERRLENLQSKCEELASRGAKQQDLHSVRNAIECGKFPLSELLITNISGRIQEVEARGRAEVRGVLDALRDKVAAAQKLVEEQWGDPSADELIELCMKALARISSLVRRSRTEVLHSSEIDRATQLAEVIDFAVANKRTTFKEIEMLLADRHVYSAEDGSASASTANPRWGGDTALQNAWEFLAKQKSLTEETRRECARQWSELAHCFSKLSAMYNDLHDTLRYTSLPGCNFGSYTTQFYSPKSAWLDRPIHLYLLLCVDEWEDQWIRLRAAIDETDDALNLVFVPKGVSQLREKFDIGRSDDRFVVIGLEEATAVSTAQTRGAPLRQLLHRGAPKLEGIGLFCTDGAVDSRKNLFVGRDLALDRLENSDRSAILGGRRIGKTSLLLALKERLISKRRNPFNVGYVYADPLPGDPDLTLAARIAESLGLGVPTDMDEFTRVLTRACQQGRVAVLIDEADRYIQASRLKHGDSSDSFPLMRVLRGIQLDKKDSFKVVCAGFKQLYYELSIRPNQDSAYPFKNFLTPVENAVGDLSADQVEELLRTAFSEMLGAALDPSVARLVKIKTSGHPAFVQMFGRQLLEILDHRRKTTSKLVVTEADVERVYSDTPHGGGGQHASYIDYVYETLNWNLSHLGRAIMLAISSDIVANGYPPDTRYSSDEIKKTLKDWSGGDDLVEPDKDDFNNTVKFLMMTGMLHRQTEGIREAYSVAYPSYTEFMVKLEDMQRIRVQESLENYRAKERGKIV